VTAVPPGQSPQVFDVAVHPAGKEIVFLDGTGTLHVCDLAARGALRPLPVAARRELRGLHFDAAGGVLTFVGRDGSLGVYDWLAGSTRFGPTRVFQLALDCAGRWAATSNPGHGVRICDVSAGTEMLALPPEGADIWALAFSPDATRVAVGMSDGSLAIWDLEQVRTSLAEFGLVMPSIRLLPAGKS
jgi:hypothetical protein